jgi:cytochrome c553
MKLRCLGCSALAAFIAAALWLVSAPIAAQQGGAAAAAAQTPQTLLPWAFQVAPPGAKRHDDGKPHTPPGSTQPGMMQPQIDDPYGPPDWFPSDHPPMPEVVAKGRRPAVRACAQCHLPNGLGHPESANLAGLNAVYIVQQMQDFANEARKGSAIMTGMAAAATPEELKASAEYFASLKMQPWNKVVEVTTVPKTFVGAGNMRFAIEGAGAGTEPIGQRIIELPEDPVQAELRNSHSGFVAHVPPGSIKKGEGLVTTGGNGRTLRCSICHGADLKGLAGVPGIAGRSPIYLVRQLYSFKTGARTGVWAPLMKGAVEKLTVEDMIAIAGYTGSRTP